MANPVAVLKRNGETIFAKVEKINAELLILTYGSLVAQLIKDYEDINAVNQQLDTMGYNIGVRLIDEFISRSGQGRCANFKETAEVIAKVGFKMFLGVTANVANWSPDDKEFSLIFDENPLAEFVDLPPSCNALFYSNILCGVLRGALEMVQIRCDVKFIKDVVRGDEITEIRVIFREYLHEAAPPSDE